MYQFPSTIFLKNVMAKIMTTTKRHPKEQHLHIYTYMRHIAFTVTLQWIIHYRNYLWRTLLLHWTLAWYKRCILAVWVRLFLFDCFVLFLNLIKSQNSQIKFHQSHQLPQIFLTNPINPASSCRHPWPVQPEPTEGLTNCTQSHRNFGQSHSLLTNPTNSHRKFDQSHHAPAETLSNFIQRPIRPDPACRNF